MANLVKHAGPPTKLTDDMRHKLRTVAESDCTVEEMCYYCGISKQTYYRWIESDKVLCDDLERSRAKPILKARQTILGALDNVDNAQWYLERKKKNEFSTRREVTGVDGGAIVLTAEERKQIDDAYKLAMNPNGNEQQELIDAPATGVSDQWDESTAS